MRSLAPFVPFALVGVLTAQPHRSTEPDPTPHPSTISGSLFSGFRRPPSIPSIPDRPTDPVPAAIANLQVILQARALRITSHSASQAWFRAARTFQHARATIRLPHPPDPIVFSGSRASALNLLLAGSGPRNIRVVSPILHLDQPLQIHGSSVSLDLGRTILRASVDNDYAIRIDRAQNVTVSGGVLGQAGWGVLVAASHDVTLTGMKLEDLAGGGILVTGSHRVTLWHNTFRRLDAAPVILHGNTTQATVAENEISRNLGYSNWDAGIVLTDRNADPAISYSQLILPSDHGVPSQRIDQRHAVPHDNVIARNHIANALTSGIYSDGGAENVIFDNRIEGNSNEGICLDNGTLATVVAYNIIRANGKRAGKTAGELQHEYVGAFGLLPDGTSPAKLPAVSLDNTAYNAVLFNTVSGNFGGGIKLVRTSFYNLIGANALDSNNLGMSAKVVFFAVEFGAAPPDAPVPDLNFAPSRGNVVFHNQITGNHFSGIFFGNGSDNNIVIRNTVLGALRWSIESVHPQPNDIRHNRIDRPTHNIETAP